MGIDRMNSDLGYIEGNMVPCCGICNITKMDYSAEEFISRAYRVVAVAEKRKQLGG
jgi:hypothetical protein